jgi:hypothetical protein
MRDLLIEVLYFIPTSLAVTFMVWVLWNLCKQFRKR